MADTDRIRGAALVALLLVASGCGGGRDHPVAPSTRIPASNSAPSWSPDGTRIAFAHIAGTEESADQSGIWIVDPLGNRSTRVLAGPYSYPDWSPDGRYLAVTGRTLSSEGGVFLVTSTGDSLRRISSSFAYAAKWSPDGLSFAYETYDSAQVYRLWVMSRDGSGEQCLNAWSDHSWFEPDWSPDGRRLVHVRSGGWLTVPALFLMDADGRNAEQLTHDGFEARYPTWSPDGQWIAWGSWHGTSPELWLVRPDGSEPHKVADGYWAEWAPDSRSLAYTNPDPGDGGYDLHVLDLETGQVREIAR